MNRKNSRSRSSSTAISASTLRRLRCGKTAAEIGDIVVALYDNLSNLKVLGYDAEKEQYCLRSRNPDKKKYADIYVTDLQVQDVAVGIYNKF